MDPALARAFLPDGGAGLAAAYHRRGDHALRAWLSAFPPQGRFRDRIAAALRHRLELADPELVRAGSAVLALPQNAALGARLLAETADTVWDGLGDTSQDVAWWTKRASVGAVYGATVLYWMGDASPGKADSWAFLDRRIDDVMGFEKLKARAAKIPGVSAATRLATGWIRAPKPRDLPGETRP
jgi:ubiquinone biosynthesis protein COQ9